MGPFAERNSHTTDSLPSILSALASIPTAQTLPVFISDSLVLGFGAGDVGKTLTTSPRSGLSATRSPLPTQRSNVLESQEASSTAMSLKSGDAFAPIDIPDGASNPPGIDYAQRIVDMLDYALDSGGLDKSDRSRYLRCMRKLCGTFTILPSSFVLGPTFDKREVEPFASGGFSDVYEATLNGRLVAIKTLNVSTSTDPGKAHRNPKLPVKEVVGWKWLQHENILPFVGVTLTPPLFSIISERMENGNVMDFVKAHPDHNRLHLLIDAVTGLEYLHGHEITHGDLKGANVLVDSGCRARLADFGLAVVIDESTTGSTPDHRGIRGTIRWMAPEMIYPERFGFAGEHRKRLPSRSTDIYSLGMTILEVITGCPPFSGVPTAPAVMCKVIEGDRPGRPPSGFSDQLWELLVRTWCAEHGSQPSNRPSTSAILDRLREDACFWGESITPSTLTRPVEDTDTPNSRPEDDGFENIRTATWTGSNPPHFRRRHARETNRRGPGSLWNSRKVGGLITGLLRRLLGFLAVPSQS